MEMTGDSIRRIERGVSGNEESSCKNHISHFICCRLCVDWSDCHKMDLVAGHSRMAENISDKSMMGGEQMERVCFDRNGPSGNIFMILGSAFDALKSEGKHKEADEMFNRATQQDSYDDALNVVREYVELVEV